VVDLPRAAALLKALAAGHALPVAAEKADLDLPQAKAILADLAARLTAQAAKVEKIERAEAARVARSADKAKSPDELVFAFDGGSRGNPGPSAGVGMALDAGGFAVAERSHFLPNATNNVAEYHGLLAAIDLAREMGVRRLRLQGDSELVVKQLLGEYKVKNKDLMPLVIAARNKLRDFANWEIRHVGRDENKEPDEAVNRVLDERAPKKAKKTADADEAV
jgi:ribonuclease HI